MSRPLRRRGRAGETPKRSGGGELGSRGEQLACDPSPSRWSGPEDDRPGPDLAHSIEIELDVDIDDQTWRGSPATPEPGTDEQRRRWMTVVAGAAAMAVIAVGAVVITSAGDGDDGVASPPTTTDPFLLSSSLTTPPTLAPVDAPAEVTADEPPEVESDDDTSVGLEVMMQPEFEPVVGFDPANLVHYDLAQAVERNVLGSEPAKTMFTISGLALVGSDVEARPASVSITASSDPASERYALAILVGDTRSVTVIDRQTHTAYRSSPALPDDMWARFPDTAVLEDTGAENVTVLFDTLVTGPLSPELLASATVTPADGLVRLPGGVIARRYDIDVALDAIQPRGALMFAAPLSATVTDADGDRRLSFEVYVTDDPSLAMVSSTFSVDGQPRTFTQFFDRRPANVRISVPSPEDVIGADEQSAEESAEESGQPSGG